MYLKSIEIQGFKSFPEKTLLQFSSGITAIVGPNGSGKSNIVDAIRWVLGEQSSRNLRGSKMEDVIFGGTQRRRPLGFCEVTLTIDNASHSLGVDYDEVAITRRYYRSGESEFFINKKSVRLKDVHELLMDTGLGREGYSIIGQGRIDEILSVKSADRREIFEEAAGITKFRYRKEEAQRRLSGTEDNLVRIRDIIAELEAQVEPLRIQAQQAQQFLILRDELRVLEVTVWLATLEQLSASRQKAQVDFENAERMLSARRRELEELYARAEQLTVEMRQKEVEAESGRVELRNIEGEIARLQSELAVLAANRENNRQNAQRLAQELETQENKRQDLTQQQAQRKEELMALEGSIAQLQQEQREVLDRAQGQQRQIAQARAQLEELAQQCAQAESALHQLQVTGAALESGAQELENRSQGLSGEMNRAQERLERERQRQQALLGQINEAQQREQSIENMLRGFDLRLKTRKEKGDKLSEALAESRRNLAALADRVQMLQSLEKEYEGFGRAVKQVLQAADRGALQGIHGPVSRLITVADEYAVAIEIALGSALSNVVTENEESAKGAIQYLKSRDLGWATFLPLTALRPRKQKQGDLENQPGFLGMADALVQRQPQYDNVVQSLLGGTVVVDTIDSAIALARKFSYQFRIVTQDGQIINASGAMTGGSLNKNTGILSRANEIARLQDQHAQQQQQLAQHQEQLAQARAEYLSAQNDAQAAGEELRTAQNDLLSLQAEQGQHLLLLQSLEDAFAGLLEEQGTAGQRQEQLQQRLAENAQQMEQATHRVTQLENQREQARAELAQQEEAFGRQQETQSQQQTQLVQLQGQRQVAQQGIAQLQELVDSLGGDRAEKQRQLTALQQEEGQIAGQLEHNQKLKEAYDQSALQKQQVLEGIGQEKLNIEAKRVRTDKEAQDKSNELLNMERERARLETKKNQAEMEERQILDKMWENYELTRTTAQDLAVELESMPVAQKRIGQLRGQIRGLGNVNVAAIEEYAKVNERYQFMDTQRKDLEKAKGDLLGIIDELTANMKEIFAQGFAQINEHFGRTFIEIFGGGSASLELEDESDILNCGIEIRVELPGKSRRAISLLSGGEKALVAIVLYFAILKVRPTPFCVLDEIEAALDDVNVLRYVQYMRTLCQNTQFILITHRRGTMEGSDILYGVTMQEQGVTKLLQLALGEVEKQIHVTPN